MAKANKRQRRSGRARHSGLGLAVLLLCGTFLLVGGGPAAAEPPAAAPPATPATPAAAAAASDTLSKIASSAAKDMTLRASSFNVALSAVRADAIARHCQSQLVRLCESSGSKPLETVRGVGYKMKAP